MDEKDLRQTKYITVADAARFLNLTPGRIHQMVRSGKLKVRANTWHRKTKKKVLLLDYEEIKQMAKDKFL